MRFPVITKDHKSNLLKLEIVKNDGSGFLGKRILQKVTDNDSIISLYNAIEAYIKISGNDDINFSIDISINSEQWLNFHGLSIKGDSLGLACFFLLSGLPSKFKHFDKNKIAISGSIVKSNHIYEIAPVSNIIKKAKISLELGCKLFLYSGNIITDKLIKNKMYCVNLDKNYLSKM